MARVAQLRKVVVSNTVAMTQMVPALQAYAQSPQLAEAGRRFEATRTATLVDPMTRLLGIELSPRARRADVAPTVRSMAAM